MITTKITVEPHLAQYCYAKYSSDPEGSMPSALRTIWMYTIWFITCWKNARLTVPGIMAILRSSCRTAGRVTSPVANPRSVSTIWASAARVSSIRS